MKKKYNEYELLSVWSDLDFNIRSPELVSLLKKSGAKPSPAMVGKCYNQGNEEKERGEGKRNIRSLELVSLLKKSGAKPSPAMVGKCYNQGRKKRGKGNEERKKRRNGKGHQAKPKKGKKEPKQEEKGRKEEREKGKDLLERRKEKQKTPSFLLFFSFFASFFILFLDDTMNAIPDLWVLKATWTEKIKRDISFVCPQNYKDEHSYSKHPFTYPV